MDDNSQLARTDINELSDEELSNLDLSQLPTVSDEPEEDESQTHTTDVEANEGDADRYAEDDQEDEQSDQPSTPDPDLTAPQSDEQPADVTKTEQPENLEPTPSDSEVDYKAFYERVTAGFKANGQLISVTDPEDIVSMMQRGAGFAKKMATLKPSMRILRTLETNGISEADLSYLIDLHKKDPEAISKLVKESGVDVYSVDESQVENYKPKAQLATDHEVELDSVVQELQASSPVFDQLLNTVVNTWDMASRQVVAQNPQILNLLDQHMQLGYFEPVMQEVERLRAIGGHIDGLSDFDAYRQVGDAMNARGVFNHIAQNKQTPVATQNQPLAAPNSVAQSQPNQELNAKRRAASTPRPTASTPSSAPNYAEMSDDELLASLSARH